MGQNLNYKYIKVKSLGYNRALNERQPYRYCPSAMPVVILHQLPKTINIQINSFN